MCNFLNFKGVRWHYRNLREVSKIIPSHKIVVLSTILGKKDTLTIWDSKVPFWLLHRQRLHLKETRVKCKRWQRYQTCEKENKKCVKVLVIHPTVCTQVSIVRHGSTFCAFVWSVVVHLYLQPFDVSVWIGINTLFR